MMSSWVSEGIFKDGCGTHNRHHHHRPIHYFRTNQDMICPGLWLDQACNQDTVVMFLLLGNVGQNVQKYFWSQTAWICEQYRYNSRNFTETGSIQSYYWHSQTCYRGKLLTLRVIAICAQSCSHCSHYSTACYLFINITLLLLLPRDASAECGYEIAFVCLSVTIRYRVQIRWNSSKIISRPNSLRPMCSLTPNMGDLVQREHPQN